MWNLASQNGGVVSGGDCWTTNCLLVENHWPLMSICIISSWNKFPAIILSASSVLLRFISPCIVSSSVWSVQLSQSITYSGPSLFHSRSLKWPVTCRVGTVKLNPTITSIYIYNIQAKMYLFWRHCCDSGHVMAPYKLLCYYYSTNPSHHGLLLPSGLSSRLLD